MVGGLYLHDTRYNGREWPRYFWNHNLDIAICRPVRFVVKGAKPVADQDIPQLHEVLNSNGECARKYLEKLCVRAKYDLYAPERDEILFGLFARLTRFYILMTGDPNLWAKDVAGILLRCLTDTAITFGYLVKCGTSEDFERFRKYGEGQEKLLLLHLRDSYPNGKSLDGRDAESIADEIGWLAPELMDIELGHWNQEDTRKLAQKAGMEKYYRFGIYSNK